MVPASAYVASPDDHSHCHEDTKTRSKEGIMLRVPSPFTDEFEDLVRRVIGCCITVHRALGPGLVEAAYQRAVCIELEIAGIRLECEKACPIRYRGKSLYVH